MNNRDVDLDTVGAVIERILDAMPIAPFEPFRGARSIYPKVWCEWASFAIALILERLGLGSWTIVSNRHRDDAAGHTWLELRDESGGLIWTIDATLAQFPEWTAPFIGARPTPAYRPFSVSRYSGPWQAWPRLPWDDTYLGYAESLWTHLEGEEILRVLGPTLHSNGD